MARTSDGTPDHARSRRSESETVLACNIRLNLFIRAVRDDCSSICFAVALSGMEVCVMRWSEFAGSRSISWYCGRSILPSTFFAVGYVGIPRSSAISPLSIPRHANEPEPLFGMLPPASFADGGCFRLPFLRIFAILGRPNSSSSSSNMSPSSTSSSSQSWSVFRKKLLYDGRAGRGEVVFLLGAALDSRLWDAEGGVRGREFDPETLLWLLASPFLLSILSPYNELKLSMSACE